MTMDNRPSASSVLTRVFCSSVSADLALLILMSSLLFLSGWGVGAPSVNAERRTIEILQNMTDTGAFLVPQLDGHPHLTKPPLYYWVSLAAAKVLGCSSMSALQLTSALGALMAVLTTYAIGSVMVSRATGWWSASLLASTFGLFEYAHRCMFDTLLCGWITLSVLGYVLVVRRGRQWGWLIVVGMVGGFLTKGPLAWIIPLLPIAADACLRRRRVAWKFTLSLAGVVIAGSLWWHACIFFADDSSRKILTSVVTVNFGINKSGYSMAFHEGPIWYYLGMAPVLLLPWTFFVVPMVLCWRGRPAGRHPHQLGTMSMAWFVGGIIFLSLIPAKAGRYVVPLLPGWSLLLGIWLDRAFSRGPSEKEFRYVKRVLTAIHCFLLLAGLVVPILLWVRIGTGVVHAMMTGLVVFSISLWGFHSLRRNDCAAALLRLTLGIALLSFPLYYQWIPAHRFLHEHHDSAARREYKARLRLLKTLFRRDCHSSDDPGRKRQEVII